MKEFTSAVVEVLNEDEREAQIKALMQDTIDEHGAIVKPGMSREDAEAEVDEDEYVDFKVDGRVMRAYKPGETQLLLMVASLGRGQGNDQRLAAIINIILECLRDDDRVYLEGRMLTRKKAERIPPKTINDIFEHCIGEWFARPTQ